MREYRSYGSVRGAPGNRRLYRDPCKGRPLRMAQRNLALGECASLPIDACRNPLAVALRSATSVGNTPPSRGRGAARSALGANVGNVGCLL